ncbi:Ubiquitin thioesterase [Drechslerella dactyloides]|uniref:ubiquitinyl hydrolase 1 n=1 Tax=Drechslerella dactyloides TaxID=74499 RepID=A0AAD6NP07_DREDA|nr:Ubiquitin thioesterase [Drechslerella dactyloides]
MSAPYSSPVDMAPSSSEEDASQSLQMPSVPSSPLDEPSSPEDDCISLDLAWFPEIEPEIEDEEPKPKKVVENVALSSFENPHVLPDVLLAGEAAGLHFPLPWELRLDRDQWLEVAIAQAQLPPPPPRLISPPGPPATPEDIYIANVINQCDENGDYYDEPWAYNRNAAPIEQFNITHSHLYPFSLDYTGGYDHVVKTVGPALEVFDWSRDILGLPIIMPGDDIIYDDLDFEDEGESASQSVGRAEMKSAQELADLERLSQAYQPEVRGPLVGDLQSSHILQDEYAGADPTYVKKTAALAPKYSNYRPVKGDGNCGWRALAFGYFELLLRTGDPEVIEHEMARIKSMNSLMDDVGMSEYLYEDFVDETIQLLTIIQEASVLDNPYDDKPLLATFNTEDKSNGIVTHLRLLTSGFLKLNPDAYQPFIETSILDFCSTVVEPFGVQIDHIAVKALIDLLFIPAGFAVEISYLDRSVGDEVNVHRFEDESNSVVTTLKTTGNDRPTLRLLYRPGHYDLIYKNGDLAPTALPTSSKGKEPAVQVSMMLGQRFNMADKQKAAPRNLKRQRKTAVPDSTPPTWFCTPPPGKQDTEMKPWYNLNAAPVVPNCIPCNPFRYNDGSTSWYGACTCNDYYDTENKPPQMSFIPRYSDPANTITLAELVDPNVVIPNEDCTPTPLLVDEIPQCSSGLPTAMVQLGAARLVDLEPYEAQLAAQEEENERRMQFTHYNNSHYQNYNFQPQVWTPDSPYPFQYPYQLSC